LRRSITKVAACTRAGELTILDTLPD
jgi:hypothetical protein